MFTLTSTMSAKTKGFGKSLFLAAIAGAMVSCGGHKDLPAAITISTKVATSGNGSVEQRIFSGVNAYRSHLGMPSQTRHSGLDRMAQKHAYDMLASGKLEHTNYEYREGFATQKYGLENLEENILRAFRVPDGQMASTAVKGWIESKDHRMNLETLNSHMGIGIARGEDGAFYAVHLSGTPKRKSAYSGGMPRGYGNRESAHEMDW